MGPILIFDKSALEGLNPDEAMWLDQFFLSNITPLFFIETLADLEKEVAAGRTPEEIVGNIAHKSPDLSSRANVHHARLLRGELLGAGEVDMRFGRPIIGGGQALEYEGKTGVMFQPSPEEDALRRWQQKEFLELERLRASSWRQNLSNIDLEETYQAFQKFFVAGKPERLSDAKRLADSLIAEELDQEETFTLGLAFIGVAPDSQEQVLTRWRQAGRPPLREFAPYFTYVFSVDLFFYLSVAADLIGRERPSHMIDLAYLYYLPFCMVFTSNDKLHSRMVPLFLNEKQTFVLGSDLKADLAKLDRHYDALPEEVKQRGVMRFASYPPRDSSFLVTRLWDKHMAPRWRKRQESPRPDRDHDAEKQFMEEMKRWETQGRPVSNEERFGVDDADHVLIKRTVAARKGKWVRFSADVVNQADSQEGEMEPSPPESNGTAEEE